MYKKAVVLSDQHLPFYDKHINELVFRFVKDFQPDHIDLLGDLIDFYSISKFRKDPQRVNDIQKEIDLGKDYLKELRSLCPNSEITLHYGNHLCRLKKFIFDNAPQLACIKSLNLKWLLGCDDLNIKTIEEEEGYIIRGRLVLTHGTIVSQDSGATAKRMLNRFGMSVIHGHTHRLAAIYKTDLRGTIGAWENGCLCDLELIKIWGRELANWQAGFSIIYFRDHRFLVQQIPILKDSFMVGEKVYE